MNIGEAALRSGVSAKMIRHYEARGLLSAALRAANGYRNYEDADVAALAFVRRARNLGFSLDEVSQLLDYWRDPARASREVKAMAERHIADLQQRILEMRAMQKTLRGLAAACAGDGSAACPILDGLATGEHRDGPGAEKSP